MSMTRPSAFDNELVRQGIPVFHLDMRPGFPDPLALVRARMIVSDWKPTIVHSHMYHANVFARTLRAISPMPVLVCTAHSNNEGGKLRIFLYRLTDGLCDATTHVSEFGLEAFLRNRSFVQSKSLVIYDAVDFRKFIFSESARGTMRRRLGMQDSGFVWLSVGRLDSVKDHETLLTAFRLLTLSERTSHLFIVGAGPLRSRLEALATQLNIGHYVHFLGLRTDIPELMNAADCLLITSKWEGFSMTLVEALASGLPTISTRCGGPEEILKRIDRPILVPPGNVNDLQSAMLKLINVYPGRLKHHEIARLEIDFGIDSVLNRWEGLYRRLMANRT